MKYQHEMGFWQSRLSMDNGTFQNSHYRKIFLAMAEEEDDAFLSGKIVADFGCGPRGSLQWAQSPAIKMGIDVLATAYVEAFWPCMAEHGMVYVASTESVIPMPSESLDVVFTLNAMDHVDNFPAMSREVLRVLKQGGAFYGSFNLNEPASPCEPQTLTDALVRQSIAKHLDLKSYRTAIKHPASAYKFMLEGKHEPCTDPNEQYVLWINGRKK